LKNKLRKEQLTNGRGKIAVGACFVIEDSF
jgi:hypothetical protein